MNIDIVHNDQYSKLARRIEQQIAQNYTAMEQYENTKVKRNGRRCFLESTGRPRDDEIGL